MTFCSRVAGLTIVIGLGWVTTACSGASTLTSPSAVEPSGTAAVASNRGPGSASGDDDAVDAGGADQIRVRCEFRAGRRSRISVDGNNLAAGSYTARVQSGSNVAVAPAQTSVGDEVEFDFDSERDDVAAGATAIAASFLSSGNVSGQIVNEGGAVVATAAVDCRVR